MRKAIVVRGRVSNARHIELDEPIDSTWKKGQLVVLPEDDAATPTRTDVFELIAHLPSGSRTQADIDQQLRQDRDGWGA